MTVRVMSMEEAEAAIIQLEGAGKEIVLPSGCRVIMPDRRHELHWHKNWLEEKYHSSDASLGITGKIDEEQHRHLSGELRLFLVEDGQLKSGKFKAILFMRIGLNYNFNSHNLFGSQDKSSSKCPFIYGNSIEEVLKLSVERLNQAAERAKTIDCSKYKKMLEKSALHLN